MAKKIDLRSMACQAIKTPIMIVMKLKRVSPMSAKFEICAAFMPPTNGFNKKP